MAHISISMIKAVFIRKAMMLWSLRCFSHKNNNIDMKINMPQMMNNGGFEKSYSIFGASVSNKKNPGVIPAIPAMYFSNNNAISIAINIVKDTAKCIIPVI